MVAVHLGNILQKTIVSEKNTQLDINYMLRPIPAGLGQRLYLVCVFYTIV